MMGQAGYKEMIGEWAVSVTARMGRALSRSGRNVTKETLRSIAFAVQETSKGAFDPDLMFNGSGRYIEMRTQMGNQIGKNVYENLQDWVRRRGVQNFERVPGYGDRPPIDQEAAIRRIALGIMFSRNAAVNPSRTATAGNTKNQRKIWWSKEFYGSLGTLYSRLTYQLGEDAVNGIREGLEKADGSVFFD